MFASRIGLLAILAISAQLAVSSRLTAQAPPASAPQFTPEQQQARESVFASDRWQAARKQFDDWLAVQTTYDAAEVATMKSEWASRVTAMTADELTTFLANMEARLKVLQSPDVAAARQWLDEFYTERGKQQLLAKYGVTDPFDLSAARLQQALAQFAADRQGEGAANTAFQQARAAQVAGAEAYEKAQQAAAASAAAASRTATFGASASPYAPQREPRPQRYVAPYDPPRYSISPWGGVWIGF